MKITKLKMNRVVLVVFLTCVMLMLLAGYLFNLYPRQPTYDDTYGIGVESPPGKNKHRYMKWPRLALEFPHEHVWYSRECWPGVKSQMANLHDMVEHLAKAQHSDCRSMYEQLDAIFSVSKKPGNAVYPVSFRSKVRKWLGNSDVLMKEAYNQMITSVYNEYTNDNANYNGLRDKRPVSASGENERDFIARIVKETENSCDFCNYTLFTAEDEFGRIRGKYSYTAANAFRWDQWHSLIIPRSHNPLNIHEEEFMDLMLTNEKWQMTVYNSQPEYKHPMILWDNFLSGGASQLHPHMQAVMHTDKYYGAIENWRRAADRYTRDFPTRNYFHDLAAIHNSLGLAHILGKAVAFAHITPKKDYELVVMSEKADHDFYTLLYYSIRTYYDVLDKFAFSMAIAFPSLSASEANGVLPAYARMVARGPVMSTRSDIGALELFTASSVNTDPYKLIDSLKKRIAKDRSKGV